MAMRGSDLFSDSFAVEADDDAVSDGEEESLAAYSREVEVKCLDGVTRANRVQVPADLHRSKGISPSVKRLAKAVRGDTKGKVERVKRRAALDSLDEASMKRLLWFVGNAGYCP
ncbi:hypothetical protein AX17_007229 [Amanita inopinata Kibby_2008]|nr:hypothetical protein AX17_007229 [Amanita inopinata Kibby_2008]